MKIKRKQASYQEVLAMPKAKHFKPRKPSFLFSTIVRILAIGELRRTRFTYTAERAEVLKKGPCLILMNHSSFIDLQMVSKILYPKRYNIVCTSDGLVGKKLLMRLLGCIPTKKFVTDLTLIKDINHALKNGTHVLMYPEASYSFDGCATPLPQKMGALIKMLKVPVVTIITKGAFAYDPLYNCLQKRKVKTSAHVKCLFTAEEVASLSTEELSSRLEADFTFDNFKWQQENSVKITEQFRADGLHRILYKCPHCLKEGEMVGKGEHITCNACGKTYLLTEDGFMKALEGETEFKHIPDWYNWEREQVKNEILNGEYLLDTDVDITMMVNYKAVYDIGSGHLVHNQNGFTLTGANGELNYSQPPLSSYSLYADYYWYEIGDVICIGNNDCLYYCFPKKQGVVSKTRLATEELFKINKANNARK